MLPVNYFITHKYITKNATFPANTSIILSSQFQITALAFCACSQARVAKKKAMAMNHCSDCRLNTLTIMPKNNPTNPPTSRCFQVFLSFILFSLSFCRHQQYVQTMFKSRFATTSSTSCSSISIPSSSSLAVHSALLS